MPLIGFLAAVIGGGLYGLLFGGGFYALYLLRGAPGATGLEILGVLLTTIQGAVVGVSAALAALVVPRLNWSWRDNFFTLVLAAVTIQVVLSLVVFALLSISPSMSSPLDMLAFGAMMVSPFNWIRMSVNWTWFIMIPVILLICSGWFRSRFES